ncbi:MAG: LCP family protein [Bacilli bacterium]|nr:LCP family protein [Bacilli bacterium]
MKNIINKLLLILLYISNILFIYNIYKLNILSNTYLSIIIIFTIILSSIITIISLKDTNKLLKIILNIITIILIIVYIVIISYIINTKNYISGITVNNKNYKTYQVLVLKDGSINNINKLKGKNIGFLTIDTSLDDSISTLKKKIILNNKEYNDIESLSNNLSNKKIDAISIDKSYIESLKENKSKVLNDTKVIYTYKVYIKNKVTNTNKVDNKPFILYISGSDSRGSVKAIARSDVNIIAVVNPNTHKILLVSIPRDYYVQLHGTTGVKDKLTHAGVYGINKSITTIEDLLDINIDRYVKVSFATVIKSVDLLDGIDIYSDKSFVPWTNKKCYFKQGLQHVDGTCALAFARERKTYTEGDRHRGENQEQVISKIIEKLSNPKYLLKYNEILNKTKDSFETSMSYEEITSLIKDELNSLAKWQIETYNLDGTGAMLPTYSMGSQNLYVMIPDENTITTAKQKIGEYLK